MRNQIRIDGLLLALAWWTWVSCSTSTHAAPPLSKGKDCICAPSAHTYGYYPARWRRWPSQHVFGMPTPAMISPETEQMPELLPPATDGTPERLPDRPATIPSAPPEGQENPPIGTPQVPMPNLPDAEPRAEEPPSVKAPKAEPAQPALPPPTLPEDPLAPPAEPDDDPVPALPQSLIEPQGRNIPALAQQRQTTTTRRYVPPVQTSGDVDETGLPLLPLSDGAVSVERQEIPASGIDAKPDAPLPTGQAPEMIEPSPAAKPLDGVPENQWTRHRENPLRSHSSATREVQRAAHWQTTAPAEQAIGRATPVAPRSSPPAAPLRTNPLR